MTEDYETYIRNALAAEDIEIAEGANVLKELVEDYIYCREKLYQMTVELAEERLENVRLRKEIK